MSNTIPSNTPATLSVSVQLTVLMPVPAVALTDDAEITFAVQNIQDVIAHAVHKYNCSTALFTCKPEAIAVGQDVYDLDM